MEIFCFTLWGLRLIQCRIPTTVFRNKMSEHHLSMRMTSVVVPYLVQVYLMAGEGKRETQWQRTSQNAVFTVEIHNAANNVVKQLRERKRQRPT